MSATKKLLDAIPEIRFNPTNVVRRVFGMVEEQLDGRYDLTDPTNPFAMLLEANATLACAAMTDAESVLRKMYESMAVTDSEIYLHMSDKDYLNRFASPSRAVISLFLLREEIERHAEASDIGNYRKIVIPKHTEFMVADLPFTMQYAIEIRIKPHGGYDVVFDNSELSPFEVLTSNVIDFKFSRIQEFNFLRLNIPISQFKVKSYPGQLTLATNYKKSFAFDDQFYYARVYRSLANGTWVEMRTTHTDQVFDPNVPTAVLEVSGAALSVSVPQVYVNRGYLENELRVDIYTTKGAMDVSLSALEPNAFQVEWRDLDNRLDAKYYSPLFNMTKTMFADGAATGGKDRLTFDQLRERVMTNSAGQINLPITNVNTTSFLENRGYSVVTDVDNVTNRNFLTTRLLPPPSTGPVVSSAGLTMHTLSFTMSELSGHATVADNGERVTLLPSTVFNSDTGIAEIQPNSLTQAILSLPFDQRVDDINNRQLTYTPFHYVLDNSNDRFESRPYYLDNPSITDKNFIHDSDTIGMSVSTRSYGIERTPTGYRLYVHVNGDDTWRELPDNRTICQLAFKPVGEADMAHMNGVLVGMLDDDRVYQFDIETNYDVDRDDNICLTSFAMYNNPTAEHYIPLKGTFHVIYAVSGVNTLVIPRSIIDLDLNLADLPNDTIGITQETLDVRLGYALHGLWHAARSVPSPMDYAKHIVDVPALYEHTVYLTDETGAKVWTLDGDDNIVFTVLHAIGDPILDQDDQPTFKARVGDIVMDNDGNPVVVNGRDMLRQIDVLATDGVYYFATELSSVTYRNEIPTILTEWITKDIADAQEVLLEQSNIYFYPKVSLGHIDAMVLDNKRVRVRSDQSFTVTYHVTAQVYRDTDLRVSLTVAARMAIDEVLQDSVVTTDKLIRAVRSRAGNDVIGVDVTGLGGAAGYRTLTMVDDAARLSIAKRAIAHADGGVGVEDAVDVVFIRHTEQ